MKISKKKGIGVLGDSNDPESVSYCTRCLEYGIQEVLGARIYKPGEAYRDGDEENFRQCPSCGLIVPIYETKKESKLKDIVDSGSNPFGSGKSIVGINNKRKRNPREKEKQKLLNRIESFGDDPDIQDVLRRGGSVTIHDDSKEDLRNISDMQPERKNNLREILDDLTDY
jgi:predicted  nucleic acid-binding Zn-ribbon protein